jgi:hypothetical protein
MMTRGHIKQKQPADETCSEAFQDESSIMELGPVKGSRGDGPKPMEKKLRSSAKRRSDTPTIGSSSTASLPSKTTTVVIEESDDIFDVGNIVRWAIDTFKGSMPPQNSVDRNDLERTGCMIYIAFAFQFTVLFVLFYVGITDYYSQLQNEFLSLSPTSGDCENISVSIRSQYLSDYSGHWETQREFQFTEALYILEFKGLEVTYEQYVANMQLFQSRLRALSNTAAQRDIGYTLVALASFHMEDAGRTMEFKFNTYTPLMFDYFTGDFSIGNRDGFCVPFDKYPIYADYDKNNAAITFEVQVDNSTATPCEQLIVHQYVNNDFAIRSDGVLPIKFDIRSIATAVAVNNGMLDVKRDLKIVHSDAYGVTAYIDPNYSDMAPLLCYPGATEADPDVCLILSPEHR